VGGIDGDPCVKETEQSASSAGVPRRSHDREDPMEDPIRGCGKKKVCVLFGTVTNRDVLLELCCSPTGKTVLSVSWAQGVFMEF